MCSSLGFRSGAPMASHSGNVKDHASTGTTSALPARSVIALVSFASTVAGATSGDVKRTVTEAPEGSTSSDRAITFDCASVNVNDDSVSDAGAIASENVTRTGSLTLAVAAAGAGARVTTCG